MSVGKLNKYLERNQEPVSIGGPTKTLIIVTDSKGNKLRNNVSSIFEREIIWQAKPGRTSKQATFHIKNNIERWVERYKNILVVLWTGTCDLTRKTGIFVDLNSSEEDSVQSIIAEYENVSEFIANKFKDHAKLLILEVPQYSIEIWNSSKGHRNPTSYKENQEILINRITRLNDAIRKFNFELDPTTASPLIGIDLKKPHKSNKNYKFIKYAYGLLTDGIHPGTTLSNYWLRQIVLKIMIKLCY
ncbi:MAG: hypothetical protein ABW185_27195 [Sedimenticola sp.]